MGLRTTFKAFAQMLASGEPGVIETVTDDGVPLHLRSYVSERAIKNIYGMSVYDLRRTQSNVRIVTDFITKNIAQLGLHAFQDTGESRERLRDGQLAKWCKRPNADQTMGEFIRALVGEICLQDDAYVWVYQGEDDLEARVLPGNSVKVESNAFGQILKFKVTVPTGETQIVHELGPESVCRFAGWQTEVHGRPSSPLDAVRDLMAEQYLASDYRRRIWESAGMFGGFFLRPKDAPVWTNDDRRRFDRMRKDFSHGGDRAGDDMLLEDGMAYQRIGFSAKDEQWLESVKLSLETVARVYGVNPTMIGILDNANYSNVREFNRSLYTNTLGPIISQIEDRFNTFLLPMLGIEPGQFVEFNVKEKLRGSFEEETNVLQTSVGGPWMTRNEARRLQNLPPIEGGDDLITPMNLEAGGNSGGRPDEGKDSPETPKIARADTLEAKWLQSARSKAGSGRADWLQEGRWRQVFEQEGLSEAFETVKTRVIQEVES